MVRFALIALLVLVAAAAATAARLPAAAHEDDRGQRRGDRREGGRGHDARGGSGEVRDRAGRGRPPRRAAGGSAERRLPGEAPGQRQGASGLHRAREGRPHRLGRRHRSRRAVEALLRPRPRRHAGEPAVHARADAGTPGVREGRHLGEGRARPLRPERSGEGAEGGRAHVRRRPVRLHVAHARDAEATPRPRDVLRRRERRRAVPEPRPARARGRDGRREPLVLAPVPPALRPASRTRRSSARSTAASSVLEKLGHTPTLFRPPGGSYSPYVEEATGAHGQRIVLWSVDPEDWNAETTSKQIVKRVLGAVRPGLDRPPARRRRRPDARR